MLWVFVLLSIFCDFGQTLTDHFELLEAELYNCKWYLFPFEMQELFRFAMMNVQQLVAIQGFGNIEVSRETSKKVKKWVNVSIQYILPIVHSLLNKSFIFIRSFLPISDIQENIFVLHDTSQALDFQFNEKCFFVNFREPVLKYND